MKPTAKTRTPPRIAVQAPLPKPCTTVRLLEAEVSHSLKIGVDFMDVFGVVSARIAMECDEGRPIDRIMIPAGIIRHVADVLTMAAESIEAEQDREAELIALAVGNRKRRRA